jgi:hypothetical protein
MSNTSRLLKPLLSAGSLLFTILCLATAPAAAGEAEVVDALTVRGNSHGLPSAEELETLAGGEDALVEILLSYRTRETPPFVGIRSQKYLLNYSDRSDVQDALAADISSEEHMGLARIVGVHFDQIQNETARGRFARLIIERGKREESFGRYARNLRQSSDSEVSRMAREAFPD